MDDENAVTKTIMNEEYVIDISQKAGIPYVEPPMEDSGTARTARLYRNIANTIMPRSVVMEEDIPENHSDGYLPILDCKMKMEFVDGKNVCP